MTIKKATTTVKTVENSIDKTKNYAVVQKPAEINVDASDAVQVIKLEDLKK
jgi:hypothetical protein